MTDLPESSPESSLGPPPGPTPSLPTTGGPGRSRTPRFGLPHNWLWFLPLLLLILFQFWFPQIVDPQLNDSFNVDFGGRNVIYRFASRRTETIRSFVPLERALEQLDSSDLLLMLGPARPPTAREQQALANWVFRGGRLLYAAPLAKPQVTLDFLMAEVAEFGDTTGSPLPTWIPNPQPPPQPPLPEANTDQSGELRLDRVEWQTRARLVAKGPPPARRWLTDASGLQAAEWNWGSGRVLLVSSDYLFSNASLALRDRRNGVLASQLLELAGRPLDPRAPQTLPEQIVFDESLNATGAPQVVSLLLTPLLRPLTLQALLLWWLYAWQGSQRFGRALPAALPARHNITDHADALGNLYWRSGNALGPLQAYVTQILADLKLTGRQLTPQRVETLAARSGVPREEIDRLLALPDEIAQRSAVLPADAAQMIRRFARLRRVSEPA